MKYYILALCFLSSLDFEIKNGYETYVFQETTIKKRAFNVLQMKCNVCHAVKKRVDIFTYENMDSLVHEINKQVFIKKKMPKGRKIKLTASEEENLILWIKEIKNKS